MIDEVSKKTSTVGRVRAKKEPDKIDYSKAQTLAKDERETVLYQNASNRTVWHVYSDDPTRMKQLAKLAKSSKQKGFGAEYELDSKQILFRKVPKKRATTSKNNLPSVGEVQNDDEQSS